MRKKTNYFKTGLFLITSFVIFTIFVITLGLSNLFEKKIMIETYFDESVQGLDEGSPVKFRGVTIGNVKEISFVSEHYQIQDPTKHFQGRYVIVIMGVKNIFNFRNESEIKEILKKMCDEGLRVKLTTKGLTGTSYLEIDYVDPESNKPLETSWDSKYIYFPSTQSTFTKIGSSVDELFKRIEKAEIENIAKNMNELIVTSNKTLKDADIGEVSKSAVKILSEIKETNQEIKRFLSNPETQKTPLRINEVLASITQVSNKLNGILINNNNDITLIVENLRLASEDLKEAASNAKRYPSLFFFGDPPKSSIMGKNK